MIKTLLAIILFTGVCNAYPHEDETTLGPHPEGHVEAKPESFIEPSEEVKPEGFIEPSEEVKPEGFIEPSEEVKPEGFIEPSEEGPIRPPPFDSTAPENGPFPVENEPLEDLSASQDGPKPEETDLKTDATFWPFYRSHSYWRYPMYRTYWTYPTYRYYRPRTYYRYYYW